jgi:signal-transduction protein with cAMP-binding, CBS, and nucleotidyltransferase domain
MSNSIKAYVEEIMNERIETIGILNTAQKAAMKMADKNVSSLVVLDDDGKAVGILTERDLVRRVCTKDIPSSSVTIQNTISSPIKTIAPDTPIDDVADIMIRNKIRHIVVADENREPIGIVSATDIVAFVRENSKTMAQVTREVLEASEKEERYDI